MDADGQHLAESLPALIKPIINKEADVTIGACTQRGSAARKVAWTLMKRVSGLRLEDLTSGFRAARARHFRKFLYLLPNKFSYPTTSTMAFFRSGLAVGYIPIRAMNRSGDRKSHIRLFHDGFRFLVIILKIGALFSPMRFFLPISGLLLVAGLSYYGYTYYTWGRLTNMSTILFLSSLFTFLIGIVSEQVSALHYKDFEETKRRTTR